MFRHHLLGAAMTALVAISFLSVAPRSSLADDIKPSSVEGQNVTSGIKLIESMGSTYYDSVAEDLAERLKNGRIGKKSLGAGEFGETTFTGYINIDDMIVGKGSPNPFDPDKQIYEIVQLAKTLFHERIHTRQKGIGQRDKFEFEAHTKTLEALSDWFERVWKEYKDANKSDRPTIVEKARAIAKVLDTELDDFITEHKGFGKPLDKWKDLKKQVGEVADTFEDAHKLILQGKDVDAEKLSKIADDFDKFQQGKMGWRVPLKPIKREKPPEPPSTLPKTTDVALPLGDGQAGISPSNFYAEALVFGGSTSASTFGSDYHTSSLGGRAALVFNPTSMLRLQFDVQATANGNYCQPCGTSSYVAAGAHVTTKLTPGTDIGAFGGFERVSPTFYAPWDTDGFVGLEARHFFGRSFMLGGQAGYFDVTSGPGTLTRATFVEGRAKLGLGDLTGYPALRGIGIGGTVGYALGQLGSTSIGASSFYWTTMVSYRPFAGPVSFFFDYTAFSNRVDTLGTVWSEQMTKAGMKISFGNPTEVLEPTLPLPVVLRTVAKF